MLIKQPWIDMIRRQHWFIQECVAYPQDKYTPPFLKNAFFVPEFRLQEDERFATIFLGAYEPLSFVCYHQQAMETQVLRSGTNRNV